MVEMIQVKVFQIIRDILKLFTVPIHTHKISKKWNPNSKKLGFVRIQYCKAWNLYCACFMFFSFILLTYSFQGPSRQMKYNCRLRTTQTIQKCSI